MRTKTGIEVRKPPNVRERKPTSSEIVPATPESAKPNSVKNPKKLANSGASLKTTSKSAQQAQKGRKPVEIVHRRTESKRSICSAPKRLETKSKSFDKPNSVVNKKTAHHDCSIWKRLKKSISPNRNKQAESSSELKMQSKGWPNQIGSLLKRNSFSYTTKQASPRDTDGESICTAQPICAKMDPDDALPITPRSLTLTNVNTEAEMPNRVKILHRCTTLTPEPNPTKELEHFRGYGEQHIGEDSFMELPSSNNFRKTDMSQRTVFSPPNAPELQHKESAYSSTSAELLQSQSSFSTSVCMMDSKAKSPRKVFSNPLMSASPELQPSSSDLQTPTPMGMQQLKMPNLSSHCRHDSLGVSLRLKKCFLKCMVL